MNSNRLSYLDSVWRADGAERLKRVFNDLVLRDPQAALGRINDERLSFPVLFILMQEIIAGGLHNGLNKRNKLAMIVCSKKIYKYDMGVSYADVRDNEALHPTLLWMFNTGKDWSGPSDGQDPYDSVIDYVSALLIILFDDKSVLKDIADLIFKRNRGGLYIHDLVWSFFQTLDRDAISLIAGYMLSSNQRDVELACKLLCRDTPVSLNRDELQRNYRQYTKWLDENRNYLYLTGEHFQMTSRPKHLDADKEAKYLGKEISPRSRAPVEPMTDNDIACLYKYRASKEEEQELLTEYSHRLRNRDSRLWYEWMQKQTAEQVMAARMAVEAV